MTNRVLAGYGYGSCTFSFGMGNVVKSCVRKLFNQLSYNYLIIYISADVGLPVSCKAILQHVHADAGVFLQ